MLVSVVRIKRKVVIRLDHFVVEILVLILIEAEDLALTSICSLEE